MCGLRVEFSILRIQIKHCQATQDTGAIVPLVGDGIHVDAGCQSGGQPESCRDDHAHNADIEIAFAAPQFQQAGRESKSKFLDPHSCQLGKDEVAQFVNQNDRPQHDDQCADQPEYNVHLVYPPCPQSEAGACDARPAFCEPVLAGVPSLLIYSFPHIIPSAAQTCNIREESQYPVQDFLRRQSVGVDIEIRMLPGVV